MKQCFKCGQEKPLTEFYKHSQMKDGHLNKCKRCTKKDVQQNRTKNASYYNQYDRARAKLPHRKAARAQYNEAYKDSFSKRAQKWRIKNPDKYHAHTQINNALRDRHITKPEKCERCGVKTELSAHHNDYNKPLEIQWLCHSCHKIRDKQRKREVMVNLP